MSVSISLNRLHRFVLRKHGYVRVLPKQPSGEGYPEARYELSVGKQRLKGLTGKDGVLVQKVPARATKAELRLWPEGAPEGEPLVWVLEIGPMPPVTEVAGVQRRLENLGFDCGDEDGEEGPATRAAVRAFEEWVGLKSAHRELDEEGEVTREAPITDTFRRKLDEVYQREAGLHHGATFEGDDERPEEES